MCASRGPAQPRQCLSHYYRRAQLEKAGKHKGKLGYPQFKTKKRGLGSFRLTGSIVVSADAIQLPRLGRLGRLGRLRRKERGYLPTNAQIRSAPVSEQADHWYVALLVEQEQAVPANNGPVVGVDLGVKTLATLSDGTVPPNPRHLKHRLKKIKRLHRAVSRKQIGSKNRKQAARRLGRLSRTIANQRANTLQQLTTWLANTTSVMVIETLHVAGMLKNHRLAQAIGDVGFAAFRRHLLYKADWYGSRVLLADRWEPSSTAGSGCGWVDEQLTLADRTFHCHNPRVACGLVMERDVNAAINLSKLAGSSSDSQNACAGGSAGRSREAAVKLASMKQEPNTFYPHAG